MNNWYVILYYNEHDNFYVCKRLYPTFGEKKFFSAIINTAVSILAEWDGGNEPQVKTDD